MITWLQQIRTQYVNGKGVSVSNSRGAFKFFWFGLLLCLQQGSRCYGRQNKETFRIQEVNIRKTGESSDFLKYGLDIGKKC